jgi:hypothetical protein
MRTTIDMLFQDLVLLDLGFKGYVGPSSEDQTLAGRLAMRTTIDMLFQGLVLLQPPGYERDQWKASTMASQMSAATGDVSVTALTASKLAEKIADSRLAMRAISGKTSTMASQMSAATGDFSVRRPSSTSSSAAASRTSPTYFKDLHALPELNLYLLEDNTGEMSSGRSIGDEYQRTLGAFFAIYWLMRLHLNGRTASASVRTTTGSRSRTLACRTPRISESPS